MFGLYVHIPFCARKCAYCDFVSYPNREGDFSRYFACIRKEASLRPSREEVDTVFFGGGTPSLPPPELTAGLVTYLKEHYDVLPDAEITMEANPETVTQKHIALWHKAGVNRLSFGAQSSQSHLLRAIGRGHDWQAVTRAFTMAREGGINNLSLDLMVGLPGQMLADVEETVQLALALSPSHLSCYSLIVSPETPFWRKMEEGMLLLPEEEEERRMHRAAERLLEHAGYIHYEISNYAKEGFFCRHNVNTWKRGRYMGLGCAAASFEGDMRTANESGLDAYMEAIERGVRPIKESEQVQGEDALFEEMMLGLRLVQGFVPSKEALACYGDSLKRLAAQGLIVFDGERICLSLRGQDIMNSVLLLL